MSTVAVSYNANIYSSYAKLLESKFQDGRTVQDSLREGSQTERGSRTGETSFATHLTKAEKKKEYPSAVKDWNTRHPESAGHVNNQVRRGKEVLRRNGAENVDRDAMTMEEYKQFFTRLMNSIPYDYSQSRDVNVWTISEKGWEQMKNDSDYEAWVLGYTSEDRSVHNPWTAMPGASPSYHTERFGASIDEHLGQSTPMNMSASDSSKNSFDDWWVKRHRSMMQLIKEQVEQAYKERAAERKELYGTWTYADGNVFTASVMDFAISSSAAE